MKRVTILTLVYFFALSGVSFAKGPGAMGGFKMPHGRWWQKPEVAEELDLTADEREQSVTRTPLDHTHRLGSPAISSQHIPCRVHLRWLGMAGNGSRKQRGLCASRSSSQENHACSAAGSFREPYLVCSPR